MPRPHSLPLFRLAAPRPPSSTFPPQARAPSRSSRAWGRESHFVSAGCPGAFPCASSVDAAEGAAALAVTHLLQFAQIGTNDGSFPGPSTDFSFSAEYAIGGQSVLLIQAATFFQIGNGLFQLKVGDSVSRTLDLGAVGLLDVKALGFTVNVGPDNSGGGAAIKSSFLLHDVPAPVRAVPEPATWAMMIGGFGMIGGAMRRRKVHVTTPELTRIIS